MSSTPHNITADRRLLLVHAHPDDEVINNGVTMAKYAAQGAHVTLVTCTAGEMGEVLVPELEHLAADRDDALGPHRLTELSDAMRILGVKDHRRLGGDLRYRDSGMQWGPTGKAVAADDVHDEAFWNADLLEAANDLVAIIRQVRPQVLVTYDEDGGYGHPDHVQAHRVAHYATVLAAARSHRPDLGPAWDIDRIYWTAMSASAIREQIMLARAEGTTPFFDGDPDELPAFVVEDEYIDAIVEAPELFQTKLDAMAAHKTQIRPDGPFFAMGMDVAKAAWGSEYYRLVKGQRSSATGPDSDLFAGLIDGKYHPSA